MMTENWWKWLEMAGNDLKQVEMARKGQKWLERLEMAEMAGNGWKCLEMNGMAANG